MRENDQLALGGEGPHGRCRCVRDVSAEGHDDDLCQGEIGCLQILDKVQAEGDAQPHQRLHGRLGGTEAQGMRRVPVELPGDPICRLCPASGLNHGIREVVATADAWRVRQHPFVLGLP